MNQQLSAIRLQMTVYGAGLGLVGGGILGAGFVALMYNPLHEMNILLIFMGTLATMLVGLVFGSVSGAVSGVSISVLTALFFKRPRFHSIYNLSMAGLTVMITTVLFLQMAYWVGRPFVYIVPTNLTWVWSLLVAVTGALVVSSITTRAYIANRMVKAKVSPASPSHKPQPLST